MITNKKRKNKFRKLILYRHTYKSNVLVCKTYDLSQSNTIIACFAVVKSNDNVKTQWQCFKKQNLCSLVYKF